MSLTGITNLFSLNAINSLGVTQRETGKTIASLSSGLRINSASDSPSGFSISEKMRSYITGLKRASQNVQDGSSYLQTAEGAASEITSIVQRMRELAVEGASGVYTANDRDEIQKEMDQLREEVDRIAESTEFNTKKLLNGDSAGYWNSGSARIGAVVTGTVDDGNYSVSVDVDPGKNQILQSHIFSIKNGSQGAELKSPNPTNISSVRDPKDLEISGANDYTVAIGNSVTAGDSFSLAGSYFQEGSSFVPAVTTAISSNASGYMIVEFTEDSNAAGDAGTAFRVKFVSAEDGTEGGWVNYASGAAGSISAVYTSGGFNVAFSLDVASGVDSKVRSGDRMLFAVTDNKGMAAGDDLLISGGGTLQISRNGVSGPVVTYAGVESLTKKDNKDGIEDVNNVTVHTVALDPETGDIKKGSLTLGFKENSSNAFGHGVTVAGSVNFEVRGTGEAATSTTRLSDVLNMVDADGNDILETVKEIRLYGNSRYATVTLEGSDTMEDVARKFGEAITNGLGMGSDDTAINDKLAQFSPNASGNGLNQVRGVLTLQTALTGEPGEISFIGDEKLLDALGLSEIQKSENNISKITVKDSRTGRVTGETVTSGDRVGDLIEGVDITIDPRSGVEARWNVSTETLEFGRKNDLEKYNMTLHIVDDRTKIQMGLVEGQTLDVSIPQIDAKALGIDKAVVTSQEEAQKAIADIDGALTKINSVRATLGAQINRLERAYGSLASARENMVESESRIRDADIAEESTKFASQQVMTQAGLSVLAQANQMPSMALVLLQ